MTGFDDWVKIPAVKIDNNGGHKFVLVIIDYDDGNPNWGRGT